MDNAFKELLQNFLKEYRIDAEGVDFDSISNFDSFWKQLGIEDELCFKPPELYSKLKFLFSCYEQKICLATRSNRICSWDGIEWTIEEMPSEEKIIEKCWNENICKYTMGSCGSLQGKKLNEEMLTTEIMETISFYQPSLQDSVINFTGLKNRLKKSVLKFDIEAFDEGKYRAEICKILYFFYDLEYRRIPRFLTILNFDRSGEKQTYFDVIRFLSNPSTESIDFSLEGWDTYNGIITKFVKYPLEKELGMQKVQNIIDSLDSIQNIWAKRIYQAHHAIDQDEKIVFSYLTQRSQESLDRLSNTEEQNTCYNISPIEALYLKISQFERIGELQDFISINQHIFPNEYDIPLEYIKRMKEWKYESINLFKAEQFVEQNIDEIAKYVYLKETPTAAERKRMKENLWKVPLLLEFCIRANPNVIVNSNVSILRVVSCLQAVLTDKKDDFEYTFYLMQKHFAHPQTGTTNTLKQNKHIVDVIKLYWVRRINGHFNANLGEYRTRFVLDQYESKIYEILCKIFSCKSIEEMLKKHDSCGYY